MRNKLFYTALPLALAATAGLSTVANAAPVVEWGYTFTSAFTNATFGAGTGTTSWNATDISWGATGGSVAAGNRSALAIVDTPTMGSVFTNGTFAPADAYRHDNNSISLAFAFLESATLSITIDLMPLDPAGDPLAPALSRTFDIFFTETPNTPASGICSDGGAVGVGINSGGCADIFVLSFDFGQFDFNYDGLDYSLFLFEDPSSDGFPQLGFLSEGDCAAAGVAAGCFGFKTAEGVSTVAQFAISIEQIPEPAMLGLFGLGLIGLGAARRRKA